MLTLRHLLIFVVSGGQMSPSSLEHRGFTQNARKRTSSTRRLQTDEHAADVHAFNSREYIRIHESRFFILGHIYTYMYGTYIDFLFQF